MTEQHWRSRLTEQWDEAEELTWTAPHDEDKEVNKL